LQRNYPQQRSLESAVADYLLGFFQAAPALHLRLFVAFEPLEGDEELFDLA
jgi:hypothetical protein